jgi:transposase-like protein
MMGLSLRGVVMALAPFGIGLSHMTVWRDLQEQAALLRRRRRWKGVRVLGIDGAYPLLKGKKAAVLIAVDPGNGQPVAIGQVDEANPQAVRRFPEPLIKYLGVSVIVTDDLASFRRVAEKLAAEQQVCQFHVRRWVGWSRIARPVLRRLRETVPKEWLWVLAEVETLLDELPVDGSRRLFELWKQIPERRSGQSGPISALSQL